MTYQEFLDALRATPRAWSEYMGAIRCDNSCPITEVYQHDYHADFFLEAAEQLNLQRHLAQAIVAAADMLDGHSADIRRDLIDACGLQEES